MSEDMNKLAEMIADLQGHIERRAHEIAEPRITEAHQTSQAVVDNIMAKAAAEEQRLSDLVAELRRHVDTQVRRAERAEQERDEAVVRADAQFQTRLEEIAERGTLKAAIEELCTDAEKTADMVDPDGEKIQFASVAVRDIRRRIAALNTLSVLETSGGES